MFAVSGAITTRSKRSRCGYGPRPGPRRASARKVSAVTKRSAPGVSTGTTSCPALTSSRQARPPCRPQFPRSRPRAHAPWPNCAWRSWSPKACAMNLFDDAGWLDRTHPRQAGFEWAQARLAEHSARACTNCRRPAHLSVPLRARKRRAPGRHLGNADARDPTASTSCARRLHPSRAARTAPISRQYVGGAGAGPTRLESPAPACRGPARQRQADDPLGTTLGREPLVSAAKTPPTTGKASV